MKNQFVYPALFINEDNGSISVFFPDFEGCSTGGYQTLEESVFLAKEALEGHIEILIENGDNLPEPSKLNDIEIPNEIDGIKVNGGFIKLIAVNLNNIGAAYA